MKPYLQQLSNSKVLQIILIIDSLFLHIQAYIVTDYYYLSLALSLTCFHIFVLAIEHFCQRQTLLFILHSCKAIAQIGIHYQLEQSWLIFAGIQVTCIIKQELKHSSHMSLILLVTQIVFISLNESKLIIVGVLRTIVNYFLVGQFFRFEEQRTFQFLETILKDIKHEEFCLLDLNFIPIFRKQIYAKLSEEIVLGISDIQNLTRIITPRDNTSQLINRQSSKQSHHEEEFTKTFSIKQIISHLKNGNIAILKKLNYETINNHYITIEKVIFDEHNPYIMISKKKFADTPLNDPVQIMIKTVHKVSHDMRNPLNAIINMQMCLQDHIEDKNLIQKYLKPSLNSCHLLLNLINDILDAAQVDNKKIKLVFRKFNLVKLIDKTISLFDLLTEKKELNITCDYHEQLPLRINSDKFRIRQILMNLLSNAIKYTQPKGSVQIECTPYEENKNIIKISILDTGFGIKPENLKLLFQEFSKVEDNENYKANPMGIGLGLMISNELAKLLNPSFGIVVESKYGTGSKFTFFVENQKPPPEDLTDSIISDNRKHSVPNFQPHLLDSFDPKKSPTLSGAIRQVESSRKVMLKKSIKASNFMCQSMNQQTTLRLKNEEKSIARRPSIQGKQIERLIDKWYANTGLYPPVLIVDDNEFNIMVLQYLLESLGIQSDSSMSGMNSIERFNERQQEGTPYQLIFMDIEMPVMDGFDTTKKLLEIDPQLTVIACSAHRLGSDQIGQFKKSGMQGAVEKPVTKIQLKELLLKLSDGVKQESQQFSYYC